MAIDRQTIFALSSAPGRGAIAVLRISGRSAGRALSGLAGHIPPPRTASLVSLTGSEGRVLDRALALWFPAPRSATGEDVAELHVHGGPAVVAVILKHLGSQDDLRLALPGEFTRRAFENGKLDLTQAEGLADLIHAETEAQAAQALRQMDGALGALYEGWRMRLLRGLALTEAVIDFPDEDVPDSEAFGVAPDLWALAHDIKAHLDDGHRGEIVREGLSVVILGPPNAGKSSLLNALARRDVAIVSDQAGTTRDVLEAHLNLGGYAVTVADTAGLRETAEAIESEGITRALRRAAQAQVRLGVLDAASGAPDPTTLAALRPGDLILWSKADLAAGRAVPDFETLAVSSRTGQGLAELVAWLTRRAAHSGWDGAPVLTRARHREALNVTHLSLTRGLEALGRGLDLAAEDFRIAARSLGQITGRVDVEDVLDVVFAEFCIGK